MASIVQAVQSVLGQYATFSGRATRSEYWWWVVAVLLAFAVMNIIDGALILPLLGFEAFQPEGGQPLSMLLALALILPNLAVGVRRLHDSGRVGWWMLIALVPVLGTLVLLYFFVQPSQDGDNEFGPPNPLG